jgi:hypothetical protein
VTDVGKDLTQILKDALDCTAANGGDRKKRAKNARNLHP